MFYQQLIVCWARWFLASISFVLGLVENQYPTESYHSEIFTIEILL